MDLFHFPQSPTHSFTNSECSEYRITQECPSFNPCSSPCQGVAAEGESEIRDMLGLVAICAPFPLGGVASGEPGPGAVGLFGGGTRGPAKGVAWGGAGREGERGRGGRVGGRGGGRFGEGAPPTRGCADAQIQVGDTFRIHPRVDPKSAADLYFISRPRENGGGCTPSLI